MIYNKNKKVDLLINSLYLQSDGRLRKMLTSFTWGKTSWETTKIRL